MFGLTKNAISASFKAPALDLQHQKPYSGNMATGLALSAWLKSVLASLSYEAQAYRKVLCLTAVYSLLPSSGQQISTTYRLAAAVAPCSICRPMDK